MVEFKWGGGGGGGVGNANFVSDWLTENSTNFNFNLSALLVN